MTHVPKEGRVLSSEGKMYRIFLWPIKCGGLEEAQAGIKIARRSINNLRYADGITLMAESEEELESLDESERGE